MTKYTIDFNHVKTSLISLFSRPSSSPLTRLSE